MSESGFSSPSDREGKEVFLVSAVQGADGKLENTTRVSREAEVLLMEDVARTPENEEEKEKRKREKEEKKAEDQVVDKEVSVFFLKVKIGKKS